MEGRLSEKTWVPAGIAVAAIGVFMGATWWLKGTLADINFEQRTISERIGRMESTMAKLEQGYVLERDLRMWIMGLARQNSGKVDVPEWTR